MSKKIRNTEVDHLFDAILTLENKEECYTFFEDVCTINELLSRFLFFGRVISPVFLPEVPEGVLL